ncbi:MAG: hypothetical protein LJE92_07170 [Gammaproteobacteria bacterium]|jgi:hypothetical protein|nr:hypothetical protein [Gammaproteobacteria bacterium]
MILEATHTHLYPGHSGRVSGLARIADMQPGHDCLVAFSDGSVAAARIARYEDSWQLHTNTYRTAAGTDIAEKLWLVRLEEDNDRVAFRILNKVPTN